MFLLVCCGKATFEHQPSSGSYDGSLEVFSLSLSGFCGFLIVLEMGILASGLCPWLSSELVNPIDGVAMYTGQANLQLILCVCVCSH